MANEAIVLGVSEFVAYTNQTLEYAYPYVSIVGELANFKISKNKWVYFDIKDAESRVRCFGTVYMLKHQLEDGMMIQIQGSPRLHPQFGFSLTVQQIEPVGEGAINRAAKLLESKLEKEGLFAPDRKRVMPYPPQRIGLVTSGESAAYADFIKIITHRWQHMDIQFADVQVQGADAAQQIIKAVEHLNQLPQPPEAIVVIRGGGSAEDLHAFNEELVVRAIAASRVPTLVAIGHENDVVLAERAADVRASTPSNAAELLVPDQVSIRRHLEQSRKMLSKALGLSLDHKKRQVATLKQQLQDIVQGVVEQQKVSLGQKQLLLEALNPDVVLRRGYALVRHEDQIVRRGAQLQKGDVIELQFSDVSLEASIIERENGEKV